MNNEKGEMVNEELVKTGWKFLRYWTKELSKNLAPCLATVGKKFMENKSETSPQSAQ